MMIDSESGICWSESKGEAVGSQILTYLVSTGPCSLDLNLNSFVVFHESQLNDESLAEY